MMCFMCLCCILTLQMEQYSHLHPFSLRMRNSLRLTGSFITEITSCAEKAAIVNSLSRCLGYGPEHKSWEPEENLQNCQETLGNYWNSLEQQQSIHKRVSRAIVSNAKTSLARHRMQCVVVTVSSAACYSCFTQC